MGALLGLGVAYGMVLIMAAAALNNTPGVTITFSMTRESVAIAYAIGVLLTLSVVAFSAWRVSHMNIVTAIRNLPDPPATGTPRTRWLLGALATTAGVLFAVAGVSARDEITLGFGVLLIVLGLVPDRAGARCRRATRVHGGGTDPRGVVRAPDVPLAVRRHV